MNQARSRGAVGPDAADLFWKVLSLTLLLLGAAVMLLPFLWMLLSSFKTPVEIIRTPPTFWPENPTLAAFSTVLTRAPFFTWMRNSLVVAVAVTALVLFTSSLTGYIFAKFDFPGKQALFVLVLVTMMVPFQVVMIPTYLIVARLHLLNTLWALVIPSAVSAFGVYLCKQFIEGIPTDLIEAARIDGAGELRIFLTIIIPLIRPTLAALGIFTFMASWNNYLWPLIAINDEHKMTIPLALAYFTTSHHGARWDLVMAATTLMVIPVIIVFLFFQREFIRGLALTGLKG